MIKVTPLHPHVGAEVKGVDLTRPVGGDDLSAIIEAFNRHAVLVFPARPSATNIRSPSRVTSGLWKRRATSRAAGGVSPNPRSSTFPTSTSTAAS